MSGFLLRKVNSSLILSGAIAVSGAVVSSYFGDLKNGSSFNQNLVALFGVLVFLSFSIIFLHILSSSVYQLFVRHKLGTSRAVAIKFATRVFGYVVIFLFTLSLLNISIDKLLIGGAAVGIILGVAAQQSLSNFFASVVLILTRLYTVGDNVTIVSGPLGGKYEGRVADIGLSHTVIEDEDGERVRLPNAAMLSGAAIRTHKKTS
ncbi:MAG: mechanosensitive ion channel domain-containing protein [Candidatus Saccharimonadales bacterium]